MERIMKTIVTYKDGSTETFENAAPDVAPQEKEVVLIDSDCGVIESIPLYAVKQIVFEVE